MKIRSLSLPTAAIAVASAVIAVLSAMALGAAAAVVEHTFIVSQVYMRHLCNETLVTLVNGQFPGPAIEVNEGDSVVVHVVNKSPHNLTIHWHGVKQRRNCWADGVPMITQRPIEPKKNLTYRFDVTGQEGTLWWHAHTFSLRGTLHGAFIIRPRHGAYPFPMPHKEIPIVIGEWWEMDLEQLDRDFKNGFPLAHPSGATINGKLGDTFSCSGAVEDGYVLDAEAGKTYLLRVINAALFAEYYLRIAGHKFMVIAADANYVKPYITDILAISPGETVDALVVMNATPGKYYMVAKPNRAPLPDPQVPIFATRGLVQYKYYNRGHSNGRPALSLIQDKEEVEEGASSTVVPVVPDMPDQYDTLTSLYFHGNLTALYRPDQPLVPTQVDERMFIALGGGMLCRGGGQVNGSKECMAVATMNNVSYHLPETVTVPLLEAQYCHRNWTAMGGIDLYTLPDRPPKAYNYTDSALIPWGPAESPLEATKRATMARQFQYGSVVEIVFQSCALLQSDANPMHLHGHDMFVLAQGLGNYEEAKDVASYNLVDPPVRNTVLVPRLGWVAIRFVADNPGVWYMHCHFDFHLSMGMTALFIVEDGQTVATSLPPPPVDFLTCGRGNNLISDENQLKTKETQGAQINRVQLNSGY